MRSPAEPVEPLMLKGKSEPVPAFRLVSVLDAPERSHRRGSSVASASCTNRRRMGRAQADARCELVTVVGDAGVGKSRLVAEALAAIEARVVRGRCLPYGEGITYWPVVEVVKQLAVAPVGSGGGGRDPLAPRRVGGRNERRRDRLGVPQAARGTGAAGRGLRRHPVGRGDVSRSDRVDGAALGWRAASAPVHGPARARGAASQLAGTLRLEPLPAEQADALIGDASRASCASGSPAPQAATRSSSRRCSRWRPRMEMSTCRPR